MNLFTKIDPVIVEDPQVKSGALAEVRKRWQTWHCSTKWTNKRFTLTFQASALSRSNPNTVTMVPVIAFLSLTITLNHKPVTLGLSAGTPGGLPVGIVIFILAPDGPFRSLSSNTSKRHLKGCLHSLDWTTGLEYWTGLLD